MIRNQWYAVLESKEVKRKPVGVTRFGEKLVLWRYAAGDLSCIRDQCCHRGAKMSLGSIESGYLQCPFHGFLYDDTGKVQVIPANGRRASVPSRYKVHSYAVKEAFGLIWIWYGDRDLSEDVEISFFEDLKAGYVYSSFSEVWNVHYSRAIENQLDVVHLPFVHKTTIGRGGYSLVNGPVVKWNGDLMTFYVYNTQDDGKTKPLKLDEILDYEKLFNLQYQVPNLWQNRISPKVRVFIAFAPIDDTHTKIYLRFYQSFLMLPILGKGVAMLSNIYNRVILHQDRRVVLSQLPKSTTLTMDENLIAGDRPIVEFRKRREMLIKENLLNE